MPEYVWEGLEKMAWNRVVNGPPAESTDSIDETNSSEQSDDASQEN